MAEWNTGVKNGQWRGGRVIASNGYVLVRVGKDHHLADSRGYAYEHRLVAERKLGRLLEPGEIPHHLDGDKQNNAPENIEVLASISAHMQEHHPTDRDRLRQGDENPWIECACGCDQRLAKYNASGRARRFVNGHNRRRA